MRPLSHSDLLHITKHLIPAPKNSQLREVDYCTLVSMERMKHELHPPDTVYYVWSSCHQVTTFLISEFMCWMQPFFLPNCPNKNKALPFLIKCISLIWEVKQCLHTPWRDMCDVELSLLSLLTLTLSGSEWLALCTSCFTAWVEPPVNFQ
jgi:hypothetical protein